MLYSANMLRNSEYLDHYQATLRSFNFFCAHIRRAATLNWRTVGDHQRAQCLDDYPSSCPFLSPLFLPLVRCREEQNFGNPGMCSISYFVIKRHLVAKFKWVFIR